MKILAIDTSNQVMSVAVIDNQVIIGEITTNIKGNHSERLMPAIDQLMQEVHWKPEELDRIAVAKGPGSYTGLRIGVTIAKTLAWTLNKELVGISSLEVLAGNCQETTDLLIPLMDARRSNIYTGLYQWQNGDLCQVEIDHHTSATSWAEFLANNYQTETVQLVGGDWKLYEETFKSVFGERLKIAAPKDQLPRASVLGLLAEAAEPVDPHTFLPDYLKLAEAEENWREAHPNQLEESYVEKI